MITKDQILDLTLEQIIAGNKDYEKYCKFARELVQTALFSRFPERRAYYRKVISKKSIDMETTIEAGILYVYIKLNDASKYILVGEYSEDDAILEIMPTKDEMEEWKQVQE